MKPATFHSLPPFRTDVNNPLDEVFSTTIIGRFPVRQINERYWKGFSVLLFPGTRILIREENNHEYQLSYQLIATENSFRRVIYVFQMDETGPEYDMTSDQYFKQN
jgi:hypothetical protein